MAAAWSMVGIVLRLGITVKDVTGDDIGGDELREVMQQRLIARSNHSVAIAVRGRQHASAIESGVEARTHRTRWRGHTLRGALPNHSVICSRPWPISRLMISRAWRSILLLLRVSCFDLVPPRAGHTQPVNS